MAGSASVLTDCSSVSRLDQRLLTIEKWLALLSGLAAFSLMIMAVVSVSGRNALNMPLPGYVDWIEQAMPLIAFMGISYVQREGGHIRMDILVGQLKRRPFFPMKVLFQQMHATKKTHRVRVRASAAPG